MKDATEKQRLKIVSLLTRVFLLVSMGSTLYHLYTGRIGIENIVSLHLAFIAAWLASESYKFFILEKAEQSTCMSRKNDCEQIDRKNKMTCISATIN